MFKLSPRMPSALIAAAATVFFFSILTQQATCLVPYPSRSLWDEMLIIPSDDPFRILEQTPLTLPRAGGAPALALARADWKETASSHVIVLDVPGMKKGDIKIEVEENRVLRISGERKVEGEEAGDGEKWHRAERRSGKFLRQFRLPGNADLDHIKAHLEDGVLKITVPKFAEEKKKQPKVIDIAQDAAAGEDVKATTKAEM